MRSNGAVHLGHDTFLSATRDSADSLQLFTSCFTSEERLAPLPLSRRVRLHPSSSLDLSKVDAARCLDAFRRLQSQREAQTRQGKGSLNGDAEAAATSPPKKDERPVVAPSPVCGSTDKGGAGSGKLSSLPAPAGAGGDAATDLADDADSCLLTRHSVHVSCDGQRVAAISNRHRQHYLFDVTHDPVNVAEWETEEVVRSVAWHPSSPHLLLTLSVTGILTVYDASVAHLHVVFQRAQQTDLKPMLEVLLRDKSLFIQQQRQQQQQQTCVQKNVQEAGSAAQHTSPCEKVKKPVEEEAAGAAVATTEGGQDNGSRSPTPAAARVTDGARNTTGLYALGEFGFPVKVPSSPIAAVAGGREGAQRNVERGGGTLLADIHATFSNRHEASTLRRPTSTTAADQLASGSPPPQLPDAASGGQLAICGTNGDDADSGISRTSPTVFPGVTHYRGRGTLHLPLAPSPLPKPVILTSPPAKDSSRCTTTSVDLVDMCVVAATQSLPPTLLLLSSSGDVFSVKLNPYCLPAEGTAVAPDGSVPLTAAELQAEAEAQKTRERMPHLCHVVQGRGKRVQVPAEGRDNGEDGDADADAEEDDEAVAVGCCRLDEDTGVHAVVVVYASGVVRGAWVDEADLIARQRVASAVQDFGRYGASSFTIHLGSGISARSFLSPTVPTTTHTVQLVCQGNILLLRTGGGDEGNEAAYIVAFPVLDRRRRGWSYWCPQALADKDEWLRESLRLPLISGDAAIPEPLALRVPFDVSGASVALGATELILFPELAAGAIDHPRRAVVTARIFSLLRSALYARSVGVETTPRWGNGSWEGSGGEAAVEAMFACHKCFLCGHPGEEVDDCTASLAALVQKELHSAKQRERGVQERQARLSERLGVLRKRISAVSSDVETWTVTLLDAIAHRRGPEIIATANQRLGLAHDILADQEAVVADWHRNARKVQQ